MLSHNSLGTVSADSQTENWKLSAGSQTENWKLAFQENIFLNLLDEKCMVHMKYFLRNLSISKRIILTGKYYGDKSGNIV